MKKMYKLTGVSEGVFWSGTEKKMSLDRTYKQLMLRLNMMFDKAVQAQLVVNSINVEYDPKECLFRIRFLGDSAITHLDEE